MQPEEDPVSNTSDEEEEEGVALPECVVRRLDRLQELEQERSSHMEQYRKERAVLEAKYNSMNAKLYQERSQIITGEKEEEEEEPHGVPQFWLNCMSNHEDLSATISEQDVDCLVYLKDISCTDDEDGQAFTLKFVFDDANPYFENQSLTKRYEIPNLLSGNEPILKKVTGTEIKWKVDKCLTHKVTIKKQKGKGKQSGQVRSVKKTVKTESFFNWFEPPQIPSMEDMNEEKAANLEVEFVMDYEIAQAFRKTVVPQAVLWFTGEAMGGECQPDLEAAVDEVIAANENK